jgi:hypothetical protein
MTSEDGLVDALWNFSLRVMSAFVLLMMIHPVLLFTGRVAVELIVFYLDPNACTDSVDWWFCHDWWPVYAVQDLAQTYADAISSS